MMQPVSAEIAQAALKAQIAPLLDPITHGEVIFVLQHGRVVRVDVRRSVLNKETA